MLAAYSSGQSSLQFRPEFAGDDRSKVARVCCTVVTCSNRPAVPGVAHPCRSVKGRTGQRHPMSHASQAVRVWMPWMSCCCQHHASGMQPPKQLPACFLNEVDHSVFQQVRVSTRDRSFSSWLTICFGPLLKGDSCLLLPDPTLDAGRPDLAPPRPPALPPPPPHALSRLLRSSFSACSALNISVSLRVWLLTCSRNQMMSSKNAPPATQAECGQHAAQGSRTSGWHR